MQGAPRASRGRGAGGGSLTLPIDQFRLQFLVRPEFGTKQKRDFLFRAVGVLSLELCLAIPSESRPQPANLQLHNLSLAEKFLPPEPALLRPQIMASGLTLGADSKASRGPRFTPFDLPDSGHSRHTGRRRGRLALAGLGDPKALTDVG